VSDRTETPPDTKLTLAAEEMNHHPDLDLAYGRLDVRLISHDVGGVTSRDVMLAKAISELARAAGVTPRPERTSVLELGLDSADEAEIRPFWAALLDYDAVEAWGEIQLRDATGRRASSGSSPPTSTTFRGRRRARRQHRRAGVLGAVRPAGQPRVPDHLAGPRVAVGAGADTEAPRLCSHERGDHRPRGG
jgi:hypothetical protein